MRRFLIGIGLAVLYGHLFAQISPSVKSFQLEKVGISNLTDEKLITAVAIRSERPGHFSLITDSLKVEIPLEPDAPDFTYFLSIQPSKSLNIESNIADFQVSLINSGTAPSLKSENARILNTDPCSGDLTVVSQSEWRDGLPAPNYTRSFHQVRHLIVHHSAGSNSNSDYVQVVRDIYLLHTEINGWSDIGYNYLISQDGTLFAGRDPGSGDQSRVRGAHFCGKNSGTLGICVLGNYETAQVPASAINTLQGLLTYETLIQELDPLDSRIHSGQNLDVISGHRDGCATLCPGEDLYELIPEIRQAVDTGCEPNNGTLVFTADDQIVEQGTVVTFYNQSSGYERYRWTFEAGFPAVSFESDSVQVTYYDEGLFSAILKGYIGENESSLTKDRFIEVTPGPESPMVYPNPIGKNEGLNLSYHSTIQSIRLYHPTGYSYGFLNQGESIPNHISPGFYLLEIKTPTATFVDKLLIK